MNEPPQERRPGSGIGCFGKGCLFLVCLLAFLVVAFIGGGFWAWHHLQNTYSSTRPWTFGNVISSGETERSQPTADVPAATPDAAAAGGDQQVPALQVPALDVQARWRAFEKAADHRQPARVELSAHEINALLADAPKLRGKATVSVEDNVGHVRVSIPLDQVYMMSGRYLNAEATVEPSADGDPSRARISQIKFGNQPVPDDILDRRLFGWKSIRGYIDDWLDEKNITYFNIQNNRVVGETRGSR